MLGFFLGEASNLATRPQHFPPPHPSPLLYDVRNWILSWGLPPVLYPSLTPPFGHRSSVHIVGFLQVNCISQLKTGEIPEGSL